MDLVPRLIKICHGGDLYLEFVLENTRTEERRLCKATDPAKSQHFRRVCGTFPRTPHRHRVLLQVLRRTQYVFIISRSMRRSFAWSIRGSAYLGGRGRVGQVRAFSATRFLFGLLPTVETRRTHTLLISSIWGVLCRGEGIREIRSRRSTLVGPSVTDEMPQGKSKTPERLATRTFDTKSRASDSRCANDTWRVLLLSPSPDGRRGWYYLRFVSHLSTRHTKISRKSSRLLVSDQVRDESV